VGYLGNDRVEIPMLGGQGCQQGRQVARVDFGFVAVIHA
jgi:hypothetical protein